MPVLIEVLMMRARGLGISSVAAVRILTGQEYKPEALLTKRHFISCLISPNVTGLQAKNCENEILLVDSDKIQRMHASRQYH